MSPQDAIMIVEHSQKHSLKVRQASGAQRCQETQFEYL